MTSTYEKAVMHVATKLGALQVGGEAIGHDQYIYFYLKDGEVVTRHILSVTAEYRRDNNLNEIEQIDVEIIYDAD